MNYLPDAQPLVGRIDRDSDFERRSVQRNIVLYSQCYDGAAAPSTPIGRRPAFATG